MSLAIFGSLMLMSRRFMIASFNPFIAGGVSKCSKSGRELVIIANIGFELFR